MATAALATERPRLTRQAAARILDAHGQTWAEFASDHPEAISPAGVATTTLLRWLGY